jgi:nuclear transcription factor Y, gamma
LWTVFISEITARAYIIADSNRRRTLSRADIAKALAKSDQFDFLIDIVPREEYTRDENNSSRKATGGGAAATNRVPPSQPQAGTSTGAVKRKNGVDGLASSVEVLDEVSRTINPSFGLK